MIDIKSSRIYCNSIWDIEMWNDSRVINSIFFLLICNFFYIKDYQYEFIPLIISIEIFLCRVMILFVETRGHNSPEDKNSEWQLPEDWSEIPRFFCWMRPHLPSIPKVKRLCNFSPFISDSLKKLLLRSIKLWVGNSIQFSLSTIISMDSLHWFCALFTQTCFIISFDNYTTV